jgi:hypothetical protein
MEVCSMRARYQARIGRERSLDLKLLRRMLVEEMSSSDGDVTIKGRVLGPLGKPTHVIRSSAACRARGTSRSRRSSPARRAGSR